MTVPELTWATSLASKRSHLQVGSTADRVADLVRSQVLEGELRPGMQLAEERLVEALSVSRNTVREALQKLSQERLVEHRRHRGVFVRRLGSSDLAALCGLRRSLEVGAVRDAATRDPEPRGADRDLIAEVRAAAAAGQRAAGAQDWSAAGTANARTHLGLAALARNERIDEAMRNVVAEMRLAFLLVPDARVLHEPYVEANGALAELAAEGRLVELAEDLDRYLRGSQRHLIELYRVAIDATDAGQGTPSV